LTYEDGLNVNKTDGVDDDGIMKKSKLLYAHGPTKPMPNSNSNIVKMASVYNLDNKAEFATDIVWSFPLTLSSFFF
jgi:hypothetical protein